MEPSKPSASLLYYDYMTCIRRPVGADYICALGRNIADNPSTSGREFDRHQATVSMTGMF